MINWRKILMWNLDQSLNQKMSLGDMLRYVGPNQVWKVNRPGLEYIHTGPQIKLFKSYKDHFMIGGAAYSYRPDGIAHYDNLTNLNFGSGINKEIEPFMLISGNISDNDIDLDKIPFQPGFGPQLLNPPTSQEIQDRVSESKNSSIDYLYRCFAVGDEEEHQLEAEFDDTPGELQWRYRISAEDSRLLHQIFLGCKEGNPPDDLIEVLLEKFKRYLKDSDLLEEDFEAWENSVLGDE